MVPSDHYAPPSADVDDPSYGNMAYGDVLLATRGQRFGARILDGIFWSLIYFPAWYAYLTITDTSLSSWIAANGQSYLPDPILLLITLIPFSIQAFLLATSGQTIGKKALGLRVVEADMRTTATGGSVVLREAFIGYIGVIPCIGIIISLADSLSIFRSSQQCLHDDIFKTHVALAA